MSRWQEVADGFRRDLLAQERAAAADMARAYGAVWERIEGDLGELTAQIEAARARGETVPPSWLFQQGRLESLQRQVAGEVGAFAENALAEVLEAQEWAALVAAQDHALALLAASAGDVGLIWDRLPVGAIEEMVGALQEGAPLRALLAELGPAAAEAVRAALIRGVALGYGPREMARQVREALGGQLARALTILRTETLRAYREASRQTYLANSWAISGWLWLSAADRRTCACCWAMHGSFHPLDQRLDGHPNCRCAMVPVVRAAPIRIPSGSERFAELDPETQRDILGPAKFRAWQAGRLTLADLVGQRDSAVWGSMRYERSLRAALDATQATRRGSV